MQFAIRRKNESIEVFSDFCRDQLFRGRALKRSEFQSSRTIQPQEEIDRVAAKSADTIEENNRIGVDLIVVLV